VRSQPFLTRLALRCEASNVTTRGLLSLFLQFSPRKSLTSGATDADFQPSLALGLLVLVTTPFQVEQAHLLPEHVHVRLGGYAMPALPPAGIATSAAAAAAALVQLRSTFTHG